MDEIAIRPLARPFSAAVELPGSKSITNRAFLLAAMASGRSAIENALFSDDTAHMMDTLKRLGFNVEADAGAKRAEVEGLGGTIPASGGELFVGGSGTAMRFLTAFLTLGRGRFRIDGNRRMRERPIGPLLEAMRRLGASVTSERGDGCPPVIVEASGGSAGGTTVIDAQVSSQFVSALLMPAPLWSNGLRLTVSGEAARPFIDMTLRMMEAWGVRSSAEGDTIVVPGRQRYRARRYTVEPDASAASYFAAAAVILGSTVRIPGLVASSSVQGDARFLSVLEEMGARVESTADGAEVTGTDTLRGVDVAMNTMPDMVPTLAAIAPFASSPTRVREVGFIRHHESDRLAAIAAELKRLGAMVSEFDDGLEIRPSAIRPAAIETYDDHRIAMAFAVVGLKVAGVRIRNPGCVAKTFPDFFDKLASLAGA